MPDQRLGTHLFGKLRLPINALFRDQVVEQCVPIFLMFPHIETGQSTIVKAISRADALRRVLPNSILASQPRVAAQHFAAIAALVEGCRCFDLILGQDIDSVSLLIGRMLDEQ